MRQSDQKSLKNETKTLSNPLKKHAPFDVNFCVEKLTTFNRIWTSKRGQVDPKINRNRKKIEKNKTRKSWKCKKYKKCKNHRNLTPQTLKER